MRSVLRNYPDDHVNKRLTKPSGRRVHRAMLELLRPWMYNSPDYPGGDHGRARKALVYNI